MPDQCEVGTPLNMGIPKGATVVDAIKADSMSMISFVTTGLLDHLVLPTDALPNMPIILGDALYVGRQNGGDTHGLH